MRIIPEWTSYDAEIKALLSGELRVDTTEKTEKADEHEEL